jgi:L-threonylcarbamoyladenylate synthase
VAEIIPADHPDALDAAVRLLKAGELVCYPTDTVYGIGAAASNDAAVRRLYAVKGRRPDNPLPLLIADSAQASFIAEVTPLAHRLMTRYWPGGLTIVMRKLADFRSLALAGQDTVGLRVPDCEIVREIVRALGEPITGTSANRSGARSPLTAQEVALQLGELVPLIIDGGRTPGGIESTVVDVSAGAPKVLRQGAVTLDELKPD